LDGFIDGLLAKLLLEDFAAINLFNCLVVPDDDVRLAVVQCLYVVALEEFDLEEIGHITKILGECPNIGAGRTELVLSVIY
jgi:hypothetical protein